MPSSSPTRAAWAGPTRTALATGIDLYHRLDGDPDGPPVVLLHGLTDSSWSFSRVMPLLPPDHAIHTVDLRGHGRSSRPRDGYDMDTLAADVVALLDHLGIER